MSVAFLTLPRELRDMIYRLCLLDELPIQPKLLGPPKVWSLALLRTNKTLFQETGSVFHGLNRFRFIDPEGLSFIRDIGCRNASYIRDLHFQRLFNADLEGAERILTVIEWSCTSLQMLRTSWWIHEEEAGMRQALGIASETSSSNINLANVFKGGSLVQSHMRYIRFLIEAMGRTRFPIVDPRLAVLTHALQAPQRYHILWSILGRIIVLQAIAHTACWTVNEIHAKGHEAVGQAILHDPFITWGFIALMAMGVILFQSPSAIRHAFYETFLHLHQFDHNKAFTFTKTPMPGWKPGSGGNDGGKSLEKEHVEIDPYEEGRPAVFNYELMISAIVPRPIGFLGTRSKDGSTTNLAPFSYTQVINHDPPIFTVGFAGGIDNAKDSLRNLLDSRECTINMISEHFIEAANMTSINAPYGISELALSGLHPAPCTTVSCSRVKESIFSIEGKLMETREFESRSAPGKKTGVLAIIEGTRFWAREDAINEDKNIIDPAILKPVARLGGITYGRVVEGFELPRPDFKEKKREGSIEGLVKGKREDQ